MTDPFVGKLTFFRVYSGKLNAGSYVRNTIKEKRERIGRILEMHANSREEIPTIYTGEIAAAIGLKDTGTGDTLCDEKHLVILESMDFPEPVISVAIEPKTKADQDKMGTALGKLTEEDPTFTTETNTETGQTIISGMGELHLDIIVDRLKREFKVEANVGAPQVAYRETFRGSAEVEGKFIRQSGGRGQYGHVYVKYEPLDAGLGFEFENKIVGGAVPREYIPSVEAGIKESMENGVLAGYPLIDVKATLYDGTYQDVDSSEMAFKIAGSLSLRAAKSKCDPVLLEPMMKVEIVIPEEYMAGMISDVTATLYDGTYHDGDSSEMAFKIAGSLSLRAAKSKCDPVLLEPMMKVEIVIPEEYMGDIMGDVTSRRGRVDGMEARGNAQLVNSYVPLSEMFGYATALRSNTQGRGTYSMFFDHYAEVPKSIGEEIIKKNVGE